MYQVRRVRIDRTDEFDALARRAGLLYSTILVSFWRTVRHKGVWLKPSSMMRWRTDRGLHAHSADAVVEQFYSALNSWRRRRRTDPSAKPPFHRRKYARLQWKSNAITLKNGVLRLSNGKFTPALSIPWRYSEPRLVELGWNGSAYELRVIYKVSATCFPLGNDAAGVDLGEVHAAAIATCKICMLINGRLLRAKRRYQNKLNARLHRLLARKMRSERRRRLIRSMRRQLKRLACQIRDILHKLTTYAVSTLHERGVQTLIVGDLRTLRSRTKVSRKSGQKLHQWAAGMTRHMLTYKSLRRGMTVELIDERYTSQTCPWCLLRAKPRSRVYRCKNGHQAHRDVVGAWNIRAKYLGLGPVVGAMASPTGVRFNPYLRRSSLHACVANEKGHPG